LLQDYDSDSVDILDELVLMVAEPTHLTILKQAQRAMNDYDFEGAVSEVEQFQQALTAMA
jgi:hypothetical protein